MNDYRETIQELAAQRAAEHSEAVERMCEQMLVLPGSRGVLVTDLPDGAFRVELSDDVPFGEIHYRRESTP